MSLDINKIQDLIYDYTIIAPLITRGNNNLISHIMGVFIDAMVSHNQGKNIFSSFLSSKKRKVDMIFLAYENTEKKELTHDLESNRIKIFNYICRYKYFNELTLNKSYYVVNVNDDNFTFLKNAEHTNISKKNVNVEYIKNIDLRNKYDILKDVFLKNDTYYLFSIELIELRVGKIRNNATHIINECKKCDLLLYAFIDDFRPLYNELTTTPNETDEERTSMKNFETNTIIYGVYKIKLEQLNKKNHKHLNNLTLIKCNEKLPQHADKCPVSLYKFKTAYFCNQYRHQYSFYITKNEQPNIKSDEELIKLFENNCIRIPQKKKPKNKGSIPLNPSYGGETPYYYDSEESEGSNETEETKETELIQDLKLNVYYHPTIKNQSKIYDILHNLIINNYRFENEYLQYGNIYVAKDYDKDYTDCKYINFCFENDGYIKKQFIKRSKMYHGYLTKDLTEIKNLSYVENINLI